MDHLDTSWESAIEEEDAQPDHSASDHANMLIVSVILFMMLKAKHRLMYLSQTRNICLIVSEDLRVLLQTFSTSFLLTEVEVIKLHLGSLNCNPSFLKNYIIEQEMLHYR